MSTVAMLAVVGWPVLDRIRLGPLAVSPHGIGIAAGYLAGSWWMLREGKKRGLSEDHIGTILLWALVGAIVGARFFYVLGHWSELAPPDAGLGERLVEALQIWEGGISLVGGIAGAVIFAYPLMRRYGYRFLQVMDSAAIGLAFGIMIGRIGDLVIGDHLGKPTNFFLGWAYRGGELPGPWRRLADGTWQADNLPDNMIQILRPGESRLLRFGGAGEPELLAHGAGVHQTALYDLLIAGALFLFLVWLNRRPRREGVLIMAFAIWYGVGRVVTDFLRIDKTYFDTFTGSQLTAIGVVAVSLLTLWRFARNPLPERADEEVATVATGGRTTEFEPPPEPGPTGRTGRTE